MCKCHRTFDPCETELRDRIRRATAIMHDRKWSLEDLRALSATLDEIVARSAEPVVDLVADVVYIARR